MALIDRIDFEEGRIDNTQLLLKTCFNCKYWGHFVRRDYNYCHKCVNNLRIKVKFKNGINIVGLYDYFKPLSQKKEKICL